MRTNLFRAELNRPVLIPNTEFDEWHGPLPSAALWKARLHPNKAMRLSRSGTKRPLTKLRQPGAMYFTSDPGALNETPPGPVCANRAQRSIPTRRSPEDWLVWCLLIGLTFAARAFGLWPGASEEHIPNEYVTRERQRQRAKEPRIMLKQLRDTTLEFEARQ